MKLSKQKPEVHMKDGFWLEWFRHRSTLNVDIYTLNSSIPAGAETRGELVTQLEYPKLGGRATFSDWEPEAISIAKRELEKKGG
jgi:hypothetical protein